MVHDKNKKILGAFEFRTEPGGDNKAQFYIRNYNTTSEEALGQSMIVANFKKDGTGSWDMNPRPFVFKKISLGFHSVAVNSVLNLNIFTYITPNTPSGYVLAGIVGASSNVGYAPIVSFRPVDSTYSFQCRNVSTNTATVAPEIYVLFIQSGHIGY